VTRTSKAERTDPSDCSDASVILDKLAKIIVVVVPRSIDGAGASAKPLRSGEDDSA